MRKVFMAFGLAVFVQFAGAPRAVADTISMNISDLGGFQFNGAGGIFGNGRVALSPKYAVGFGDTVDFGIASLSPDPPDGRSGCTFTNNCYGNYIYDIFYLKNGIGGLETAPFDLFGVLPATPAISSNGFIYCPNGQACPSITIPLKFTLPPDVNGIQFAFEGSGVSIAPPVPELSTWAMLLIGFAGLAFAGYRRSIHTFVPSAVI